MQLWDKPIKVASRQSPLALSQVAEIESLIPGLKFDILPITTMGDHDQITSLRTMGKTDFFTWEVDKALLEGHCRIAIHSAKDLPEQLPSGLSVIALSEGVDRGDSLVLRPYDHFYKLPAGASIATSSLRREESVLQLRPDLSFCDVRGTIQQRLALLDENKVSGVVVAEAALIRLKLTTLNRIRLPGPYTPLQGRLAVMAREDDVEMRELFKPIDKGIEEPPYRSLHVGITPPRKQSPGIETIHCPLIKTKRRMTALGKLSEYTHCIFTSKSAVHYFFEIIDDKKTIEHIIFFTVGMETDKALRNYELSSMIAPEATAEGLCRLLDSQDLSEAKLLWPRSSLARSVIDDFARTKGIPCDSPILYDTDIETPAILPDLNTIDEIFFSSPSTIDAFCQLYGGLPLNKALCCCGPVTKAHLKLFICGS